MNLNYRHLQYFWVVAKEGSVTRAAERLGVAVQTVSGQIGQLEKSLGRTLFAPQGRGLVLTEAGRIALGYADQIFLLGEQMTDALLDGAAEKPRLAVGISDALPKLVAYRLIDAALGLSMRPVCYEGKFENLLADLALHRLDVVLTDRPADLMSNLRVFSHSLGEWDIMIYGSGMLAGRFRAGFPQSLDGAPMLLPTRNNALRGRLDQWFQSNSIRPDVVGEFEDSALLMTFGRTGLGLFPAPVALAGDVAEHFNAESVGLVPGVQEHYYAISSERRIRHPGVEAILSVPRNLDSEAGDASDIMSNQLEKGGGSGGKG
ncbi:MAG: LysR family transcriptional regulator [Burkholderiales bacterium]|nr:LysR family transcriptional regulator [Burkholderiales bacterium]